MSLDSFETEDAHAINKARMDHLETLGIPLAGKSVLDVGCGVGHLASRLVRLGAVVTCTDARHDNLARLRQLHPELERVEWGNVEIGLDVKKKHEIVFCYGLLYHVENPLRALRVMASVTKELLLLETIVADHETLPVALLVTEPPVANQALRGIGVRPSPEWVRSALSLLGLWVYEPKTRPAHRDFEWDARNDHAHLRDGHPIRRVFVASRRELALDTLTLRARPA